MVLNFLRRERLQRSPLDSIRERVGHMLQQASALPADSLFRPSKLWARYFEELSHVQRLSDAELQDIRQHSGLITGGPDQHVRLPILAELYDRLTEGIPSRYRCSEPVNTAKMRDRCLPHRGAMLTRDMLAYQSTISNFWNLGIFDRLPHSPVILEIGGGYGGLAHQLHNIVGGTYVIVDLPDMLFWSATFLTIQNPHRRIHVGSGTPKCLSDYDFILLPAWELENVGPIYIAINQISLQEMRADQIDYYSEWLGRNLRGMLYLDGFWIHPDMPATGELDIDFRDILRRYLDIFPEALHKTRDGKRTINFCVPKGMPTWEPRRRRLFEYDSVNQTLTVGTTDF